jgi:hypothetical protein
MFFKPKDSGETRSYEAEGTFFEGCGGHLYRDEDSFVLAATLEAIADALLAVVKQLRREVARLRNQSGTVLDATVIDDIVSGS